MTSENRLITITPSHYCEKARWALELAGVEYREERHPPLLHVWAVKAAGGRRPTPVLVTRDGVFADSTDILEHIDGRPDAAWRPYPDQPQLRSEVQALEEHFDTALGPHTRRLAYYYLLPHKELVLQSMLPGVEGAERVLYRIFRPAISLLMRRSMRIDDEGRRRSLKRVRQIFAEVGERLADGRPHLVGEEFTAADLTFAALGAPAVLAPDYGSPLPSLAQVPDELRQLIGEFRATAAGAFVLRCYERYR
jgi:glutathione S-transferase